MFHPMVNDNERDIFNKTGAWPVLAGLSNAVGEQLYITKVRRIARWTSVVLGNEMGINSLILNIPTNAGKNGDVYEIYTLSSPLAQTQHPAHHSKLIESRSPRYIVNVVSAKNKPAAARVRENVMTARNFPLHCLRPALESYHQGINRKDFSTDIMLSKEAQMWLLDYYKNNNEIPSAEVLNDIEEINKRRSMLEEHEANRKASCDDMFVNDKLLVWRKIDGKVMVGKVSGSIVRTLMDERMKETSAFYNPKNYMLSLQTYSDYDSIDPEIKDKVLGRLAMIKLLRERMYPSSQSPTDPLGFMANAYMRLTAINTIYSPAGQESALVLTDYP
jgi:hypothetical protein